MTIGERIKDFRKIRGMTQNDLADEMGVSVQSVSKWETDKCSPDISLLVPLSTVLGISTDTLLGKSGSGYEELKQIGMDIYSDTSRVSGDMDFEFYKKALEFSKCYPYDDNITIALLYAASAMVWRCKNDHMGFSGDEADEFFSVAERANEKVMKSDLPLYLKCEAQCHFTEACYLMGYKEKTKQEIDKYAEDGWFRAKIENIIADYKKDTPEELRERLDCQRKVTAYEIDTLLRDCVMTVNKMGTLGDAYAKETIKAGEKILQIVDSFIGVSSEYVLIWTKLQVMRIMGGKYIVLGDVENALLTAEQIADHCDRLIEYNKSEKPDFLFDVDGVCGWGDGDSEEQIRERGVWWFLRFWDIYDDKENNPVVTSPRYKAAVERVRGGKGETDDPGSPC